MKVISSVMSIFILFVIYDFFVMTMSTQYFIKATETIISASGKPKKERDSLAAISKQYELKARYWKKLMPFK